MTRRWGTLRLGVAMVESSGGMLLQLVGTETLQKGSVRAFAVLVSRLARWFLPRGCSAEPLKVLQSALLVCFSAVGVALGIGFVGFYFFVLHSVSGSVWVAAATLLVAGAPFVFARLHRPPWRGKFSPLACWWLLAAPRCSAEACPSPRRRSSPQSHCCCTNSRASGLRLRGPSAAVDFSWLLRAVRARVGRRAVSYGARSCRRPGGAGAGRARRARPLAGRPLPDGERHRRAAP